METWLLAALAGLVWLRMLWRVPLFAEGNVLLGLLFLLFGLLASGDSRASFLAIGSVCFCGGFLVRMLNRAYGRDMLGGPPRVTGETVITMPEPDRPRWRRHSK